MKVVLGFVLAYGCAAPSGECSHKNADGSYSIVLGCGEDTAASDTGADTESDTGAVDDDGEGYVGDTGIDTSDVAIDPDTAETDSGMGSVDEDGDGYADDVDCDDTRDWAHPGAQEVCWQAVDADCDGISGKCWSGLTGPNLFSSMAQWDMEDPIGTGTVAGIVTVSGSAAATSDCTTTAMTDTCSAKLQGPGSWTIESSLSATAGDSMFCFASLLGSDSSVPTTVEVYRGATLLISVSHEAFSSAWTPTSEMIAVVPASTGTVVMEITLPGADAVWLDAVVCQQAP